MPFALTWMDLEIVILSEVSQKETTIMGYCLYVESKNGTNELIYKTETDVEYNLMVTKGERPPGGGNANPLQYSCPKNSMDKGAWQATVHGVTKS